MILALINIQRFRYSVAFNWKGSFTSPSTLLSNDEWYDTFSSWDITCSKSHFYLHFSVLFTLLRPFLNLLTLLNKIYILCRCRQQLQNIRRLVTDFSSSLRPLLIKYRSYYIVKISTGNIKILLIDSKVVEICIVNSEIVKNIA